MKLNKESLITKSIAIEQEFIKCSKNRQILPIEFAEKCEFTADQLHDQKLFSIADRLDRIAHMVRFSNVLTHYDH